MLLAQKPFHTNFWGRRLGDINLYMLGEHLYSKTKKTKNGMLGFSEHIHRILVHYDFFAGVERWER
jgi:hypothetical protein